jgi:hypothetical protein
MRRVIWAILIIAISVGSIQANPLPWARIEYVNAFPPEIGIMFWGDSISLTGDTIYTTAGTAVIGNHAIPDFGEMLIFDSSNTTGLTLNSEADTIFISSDWYLDPIGYGTFSRSPAPIKGNGISYRQFGPMSYRWTFSFSSTYWGETDIVLNEINAHCDWGSESNFIELYNQSDSAIDIGGWMLVCDTICTIPQNTIIDSNGFFVIDEHNFPDIYDMDSEADNIYLIRADSVLVDQVGWSSDHGSNVSFMRFPDGDVDTTNYLQGYMGYNDASSYTFEDGFPSRGAPNRHTSPGFVVIGAHGLNESGNVDLSWTDPIWEPVFAYSLAVRDFNHYPQDITDGDVVYQGTDQQVIDMVPPGHAAAYYTIFARNAGGGYSIPTDESRVMVPLETVGIDQEPELPERISSLRCYPNPFNATVTVDFILGQPGMVNISVYNLRGQRVTTLADGAKSAGEHHLIWNGSECPSGVYFVRMQNGGISKSTKMVLLK